MSVFKPYMKLKRIEDVKLGLLKHLKIKLILVDIDNTLVEHGLEDISIEVEHWLNNIKRQGIRLILVSNNSEERVRKFANNVSLTYVSKANKPFPFKVVKKLKGYNKSKILLIGDQVFTDIVFANLLGIRSILLEPINENEPKNIKLKRILERPLRKN